MTEPWTPEMESGARRLLELKVRFETPSDRTEVQHSVMQINQVVSGLEIVLSSALAEIVRLRTVVEGLKMDVSELALTGVRMGPTPEEEKASARPPRRRK